MNDPRPTNATNTSLSNTPADPPPTPTPTPTPSTSPAITPRRPLSREQMFWLLGSVALLGAIFYWLGPILSPFLFGAMLAYIGSPLVSWGARHRIPRSLGALLVIVLMFGLAVSLFLILSPLVQKEISVIMSRLPALATRFNESVLPWLQTQLGVDLQVDVATIKQLITDNLDSLQGLSGKLLASLRIGGLALLGFLVTLLLVPVVMFYLLRDWDVLLRRIDKLVPRRWHDRIRTITLEIDQVLAQFLRGQISVMLVLAIYYALGLWLVGLEFAVPIGVLTGLLVFIPYLGYGLGLMLAVLVALLQWSGWPGFIAVLAVYGLGQILESFVLTPIMVGERIGLHPLAVIFALLAFGQLFGFFGILLALPASAALLVGLRHARQNYLASELYRHL